MELCPDDPSGYSNRGYAFRKLGDYEAAVEDYSTAISLSGSSSTRLHNNRAYCLAKLGRYQEAIADYDAVVGMDRENVHAYHNRCVYVWREEGAVFQATLSGGSLHINSIRLLLGSTLIVAAPTQAAQLYLTNRVGSSCQRLMCCVVSFLLQGHLI